MVTRAGIGGRKTKRLPFEVGDITFSQVYSLYLTFRESRLGYLA